MKNKYSIFLSFSDSKKEIEISLTTLIDSVTDFLELYATKTFLGEVFCGIIKDQDGGAKFRNLLKATGHENMPENFFKEIFNSIINTSNKQKVIINGIALPYLLLVTILEKIIPGKGYVSIKNTKQLEKITNLDISEEQRSDLEKVIDKYPVRLSKHIIRQMMVSKDIACQYIPFVEELDLTGHENTWIGQFHDGILEQMYQNRVILLLNMSCPVYCRFCFRKHKDSRNEKNPTLTDVKAAVKHVRNSPLIKEVLVTGGDPFLNMANMKATINGLMKIDHIKTLRLATRSIAYYPDLFLKDNYSYLKYLEQKNTELQQVGKKLEIATHFIHPDEVSVQSLEIITKLVKSGIAVYIQTPFLNNCNDKGPELVRLFSLLRGAGAEMHYIFIPCSPIHGNSIYRAPLSNGINIAKHLRAHLSDRIIPRICTATPIGKMDWYTSGWAVEKVKEKETFIWIRTPYTLEYFKNFAPLTKGLRNIRINNEGTIDIQYLAQIGEESHLIGSRPKRTLKRNQPAEKQAIDVLKSELISQRQTCYSIVNTAMDKIFRLHETRVEIDIHVQEQGINYIASDNRITDVIISSDKDAVDSLYYIGKIIKKLKNIDHVNSVRVRSMKFNFAIKSYTNSVINKLGKLNQLTIANPLRLEIETWFILSDEISKDHYALVQKLNNQGITVYCNTPLLGGVNDSGRCIHDLAYNLRKAGIEFHHLYVAGLPIQNRWNQNHPIDSYDVIDIATKVRREGSGREIPRYIILTFLGEVDYGLTSSLIHDNNELKLRLDCYDETYFKTIDPDFSFDKKINITSRGIPLVNITGLVKAVDFPI